MVRSISSIDGIFSLGDLQLTLINYIIAKQKSEGMILRIADIGIGDHPRHSGEQIKELLGKFAIQIDQLTHQSDSLHRYQQLAVTLVESGDAKTGDGRSVFLSYSLNGASSRIEILDINGNPTPLFANAVDDMLQNITTVVSSKSKNEYLLKQCILSKLGFEADIEHIFIDPLSNGEKIDVIELLRDGYLPDAIINSLLAPFINDAIFSLPDVIEQLEISTINGVANRFDIENLKRLNREHLKRMDPKRLSSLYGFADTDIGEMIRVYLDKVCTISELDKWIKPIFKQKKCPSEQHKKISDLILSAPPFREYSDFYQYIQAKTNLSNDKLDTILKWLLTGSDDAPELEKIYSFIKSYILEVARCH